MKCNDEYQIHSPFFVHLADPLFGWSVRGKHTKKVMLHFHEFERVANSANKMKAKCKLCDPKVASKMFLKGHISNLRIHLQKVPYQYSMCIALHLFYYAFTNF